MVRGLVLDHAGVLTDVGGWRLLEAVRWARTRGVRTALLSNAAGGSEARRGLGDCFDVFVFSGEVGVDVAVYRLTADRLGVAVDECVFVDDSPRNVAGAVAAGMIGVRHVNVDETLAELSVLIPGLDRGTD